MCSYDGLIKKRVLKKNNKDILADFAKMYKSSAFFLINRQYFKHKNSKDRS
jgi:hypothetical protein